MEGCKIPASFGGTNMGKDRAVEIFRFNLIVDVKGVKILDNSRPLIERSDLSNIKIHSHVENHGISLQKYKPKTWFPHYKIMDKVERSHPLEN